MCWWTGEQNVQVEYDDMPVIFYLYILLPGGSDVLTVTTCPSYSTCTFSYLAAVMSWQWRDARHILPVHSLTWRQWCLDSDEMPVIFYLYIFSRSFISDILYDSSSWPWVGLFSLWKWTLMNFLSRRKCSVTEATTYTRMQGQQGF